MTALAMALAAQAGPVDSATHLTVLVLAGLAIYSVVCLIWWQDECSKCGGKGRFPSPSGKYSRPCPRCKGKPRKVRLGARVLYAAGRAMRNRNRG